MRKNPSHKTYERRWKETARVLQRAAEAAQRPAQCDCKPGECPDKPSLGWTGTAKEWARLGRST